MLRGQKGLGHILSGTDAGSGGASPKAVCRIINTIIILLVKVDAMSLNQGGPKARISEAISLVI
jgi:hypothetical protein